MSRRQSLVRTLLASAAVAAAFALGGCETDGLSIPTKALKELSPEMLSMLEQKHMPKETPILVRLFKEEAEFEVWKQDDTGRFALLRTYAICRWSGELGPKIKEGDRQAPEGFYTITPGQMNPNSAYYLSFNLGYPNAFDKAYDRTGAELMVHGDCSSRGCYAMTDEQIGEIYSLARESFFGGQKSFQVQAYPFRMTPLNLAKHRDNPSMPFWRNLKEGYDHFEVTRLEPKVNVCEKRYVFDAGAPANATNATPLKFDARGKCPAYEVPQELADAVKEKQGQDEREFADLVKSGTQTVAVHTGTDGGMHPMFLAKLRPSEVSDSDGRMRVVSTTVAAPASMGNNVVPPHIADATSSVTPTDTAKASLAAPEGPSLSQRIFGGWFKTASADAKSAPQPQPPRQTAAVPARAAIAADKAKPSQPTGAINTATTASMMAPSPARPQVAQKQKPEPQQPEPQQKVADGMLTGAQPMLQSSTFDSRWGALR